MTETTEAFIGAVIQGGFSIAVATFLLLRMERELKMLREAILLLMHHLQISEPFHGNIKSIIEEKRK